MSAVFSRYVFKNPVINQLLDGSEYELTNWADLVITVIRKPNPIIIFLFHSKYFQLQQNMPTSLYVQPRLHYLILGSLVFWRDVYSVSHFFKCRNEIVATFPWHRTNFQTANKLEQTLSVQYLRFVHTKPENDQASKFRTVSLCEWTEHLNARIFNLWKTRPEPCERNLSKGWVDASDMPFHRTRLPAPTYRLGRLSNDDGDGNENGKKTTAFDWQNQKLCTCITVFCTFLCRHILFKWRFCSRRGRRCLSSLKRTQGPEDAYGETACR